MNDMTNATVDPLRLSFSMSCFLTYFTFLSLSPFHMSHSVEFEDELTVHRTSSQKENWGTQWKTSPR